MTAFPSRGLYAIADAAAIEEHSLVTAVAAAIRGGAAVVQYRDKSADNRRRRRQAAALLAVCRAHAVPFIVNDDVDLAAAVGADGVHVGHTDRPLVAARAALGADAIVGVSCNNVRERALRAQQDGATYVAFGRFFPSRTKPDAVGAPLELLREARPLLRIPVVAIGGITPANGAQLLAAGADLLAAIHGVFGSGDPEGAARRYADLFAGEAADGHARRTGNGEDRSAPADPASHSD